MYLLLSPQALGDTVFNAVIQKSCYHTSGNEIQWVQLQSYFPWMQSVHLIFLRFVLTQWIIIAPWKPVHHRSIGLTYPQIHFCNNPRLLPHRHTEQAKNTHMHACSHMLTLSLSLSVDMTQSSSWWFYAIRRILMYFAGIQSAAYMERIPAGLTHWLTGCRWGWFPFRDNLLCWNDIWKYMTSNLNLLYIV